MILKFGKKKKLKTLLEAGTFQLKQLYKGFFFFFPCENLKSSITRNMLNKTYIPSKKKKKKGERRGKKNVMSLMWGYWGRWQEKRRPWNPWRQERVVRKGCTWRAYISLQWLVDSRDGRTLHDASRRLLLKQPGRLMLFTKSIKKPCRTSSFQLNDIFLFLGILW